MIQIVVLKVFHENDSYDHKVTWGLFCSVQALDTWDVWDPYFIEDDISDTYGYHYRNELHDLKVCVEAHY